MINNTHAPSYKIAKHLNKKLLHLICLPHTYSTKNSQEIAEELKSIQIKEQMKIITLDIKDLYVNLPIYGITQTAKFWLNKHGNDSELITQTLYLLETILKQNYFQQNERLLQPEKGITVGSPISSTMAEVYLQHIEEMYIKQWLDSKEIVYYRRYVGDILIIYDQNRTNELTILHHINTIDRNFQFKMSTEENNTINYFHISIHRNNNNTDLHIYGKPTSTDTTIHFSSNHHHEHKIAAVRHYIHRMIMLPITEKSRQEEWKTILTIAKNNGYLLNIIKKLKIKLIAKKQNQQLPTTLLHHKKWITFTYFSPIIRRITNQFKHSNLKIAHRTTNTIQQQLTEKPTNTNPSGIYKLKCNTCDNVYV